MKVGVLGLWHLGCVTAACVASCGYQVMAYDPSSEVIKGLQSGFPPIFEPGLSELIAADVQQGKLSFSSDPQDLRDVDVVWVTYDTPVDDEDKADTNYVIDQICHLMSYLNDRVIFLVSSQLPVGSMKRLQDYADHHFHEKSFSFACSPENLRLGKAIDIFLHPDRIIVGVDSTDTQKILDPFLKQITDSIIWMSIPSAEMTKHAINAFLANSVVFINELATICEAVGADAGEVEHGLKSEVRIGPKAYLHPGGAFAGGTLARDLHYLVNVSNEHQLSSALFPSIIASNDLHKQWVCRKAKEVLGSLTGKRIAFIGLTYKEGTNTLRRSLALENALWLASQGASVVVYDPALENLPDDLSLKLQLMNLPDLLNDVDMIVIQNAYPDVLELGPKDFQEIAVLDGNGLLSAQLEGTGVKYFRIGKNYEPGK